MLDINKKSFSAFINKVIGPLIEYDTNHNSPLVETLQLYYRCNGNIQQAARRGYLNPSTLKYRLKRIQEIAGIELDDPDTSLQVQLALKLLT
jgi:purine catabolism regulator